MEAPTEAIFPVDQINKLKLNFIIPIAALLRLLFPVYLKVFRAILDLTLEDFQKNHVSF